MPARDAPPKGIQAVEIAMRILDALTAETRPVPLRRIAAASGIPSSNLRFYLISLLRTGLVSQEPVGGNYSLGPSAIRLGLAALAQFDVIHSARAELHRIAAELGFTTFLSVWGTAGAVAVDRVEGRVRTVLEIRVGTIFPLLTSAVGRCFVATLPTSELLRVIEREPLATTGRSRRDLNDEIAAIRADFAERGITSAPGLVLADFNALAAPIRDSTGLPIATLSIVGPIGALAEDPADAPATMLRQSCTALSRQLGWETERQAAAD